MKIQTLVLGSLQENCYIVSKGKLAIIIDPGDEPEKIINACKDLRVVETLVTHHHFDHIGALHDILNEYHLEENNKSNYFNYEVIRTPGHTSDSISFYFPDEQLLFCGDFLFKDSIGRTDLPTGDIKEMIKSLKKISTYSDDIIIYPGHGEPTILGREKENFKYYY